MLVVAFVGLSLVADKSAGGRRIVTGMVTQWHASESMRVARGTTDPGFEISLRPNTVYESDTSTIKTGVRVTVWYRNVAERHLVADRVRVLTDVTR
jgi:hypothetical protein